MEMVQLSFDTEINDERKAFELIYPKLCDIIYNAPIDSGVLIFKEINNCSSVYFLSTSMLFFQIRLRKKTRYLAVPEDCKKYLPDDLTINSSTGTIRIPLNSPDDILQYTSMLRALLTRLTKMYHEFGCCSRYEACSDARTCIHPDIKFSLGCQYRHNLMDGKIFYGKNKNI